jgi:hypothetical protein
MLRKRTKLRNRELPATRAFHRSKQQLNFVF